MQRVLNMRVKVIGRYNYFLRILAINSGKNCKGVVLVIFYFVSILHQMSKGNSSHNHFPMESS